MRRLLLLSLIGCGPTYWRGPVERVHEAPVEERMGIDASLEIRLSWKMPAEDKPRPDWLGPPGEAKSSELLRIYAPGAFHNGHLPAYVQIPKVVRTQIELEHCEPISTFKRTVREIAADVERCAARFVDSPAASIHVVSNPEWSIDIVVHGRRKTVPLRIGETMISAVASAVPIDIVRHQRVSLSAAGQTIHGAKRIDLMAIANGEQPDFPLRPGDVVVIE